MENRYAKIKTMVSVFDQYGMTPVSKVKKKDFVNDLGFDKVYVEGLFYDVERAMHVDLDATEVELLHTPNDLINFILTKSN